MARHPDRRLFVEARHGPIWTTVTVLSPDRAERAAAIAEDALRYPAFTAVRITLETWDQQGKVIRRPIFHHAKPMAQAAPSRSSPWRRLAPVGWTGALALAAWAIVGIGDSATASFPRADDAPPTRHQAVLSIDLPPPLPPPAPPPAEAAAPPPEITPLSAEPESARPRPTVRAKPEPVARPRPAVAEKPAKAPPPPSPITVVRSEAPAVPSAVAFPQPAPPAASGELVTAAPVATWLDGKANPFDPDRIAFSAAPLPPEAVRAPALPPPVPVADPAPPPEAPKAEVPARRAVQPPLQGVSLVLAENLALDRPRVAGESRCRSKKAWQGVYCLEAAEWTGAAKPLFAARTALHPGSTAVVRYDEGRASRYHVQFRNLDFDAVLAYFESRFGPPTEIPAPRTAWLGRERKPNDTYRWISLGSPDTVLEIRRYDDVSGTFPDRAHGVIELARAGSAPIFRELSSLDLVRIFVVAAQ